MGGVVGVVGSIASIATPIFDRVMHHQRMKLIFRSSPQQPRDMGEFFAELIQKQMEAADRLAELKSEQSKLDEGLAMKRAELDAQQASRYESKSDNAVRNLRRLAREKIGIDMDNKINVCIIGQRGVGKSSVINGLRGIKPGDEGAAVVDVNEVLGDIQQYPYPNVSYMVLWDVPGGGTLDHPGESYFLDKCLFAFDYLLVLFTDTLGEFEIDLIKRAIAYNTPFAVVRNKVNIDFVNLRLTDHKFRTLLMEEAKKELIQTHRDRIVDSLHRAGISTESIKILSINAHAFVFDGEIAFEESRLIDHIVTVVADSRGYREDLEDRDVLVKRDQAAEKRSIGISRLPRQGGGCRK